jgi:hypothetical protein
VGDGVTVRVSYQEAPSQGNVTAVSDCTTPSPSAVADDIYYCSIDDPWDKRLHRVTYGGQLPHVQPTATTDPFALLLGDVTRCRLRNGGAWGGRDDGYVGVYGCGDASSNLAVLFLPSQGAGSGIAVDGQSRSTRHTDRALSAAPDPHGDHRVVRRGFCARRRCGLLSTLSRPLPSHGDIAWLSRADRVGRGYDMTAAEWHAQGAALGCRRPPSSATRADPTIG